MLDSHADEVSRRFSPEVADAIVAAYAAATVGGTLTYEQRLAIVTALLDEAEAGHVDPTHLQEVALIFVRPSLV